MTAPQLAVPFNGDLSLLNLLEGVPVCELYGCLTDSAWGAGRSRKRLRVTTREALFRAAEWIQVRGGVFNYLLNAAYYEPQALYGSADLIEHLEALASGGVASFTITLPHFIPIIRQVIPHARIVVSKFARVASVARLRFWHNLGANDVCVDSNITRDLPLLRSMVGVGPTLRLLVNDVCLLDCPIENYHAAYEGLYSTDRCQPDYVDYCLLFCKAEFYKSKLNILRSTFVRPEDVSRYEGIGVSTFKLGDRNRSSDWIARAASAYAARQWNGNLCDILSLFASYEGDSPCPAGEGLGLHAHVDNVCLDGLLDIQDGRCRQTACEVCRRCEALAERAVTYRDGSDTSLKNILGRLEQLLVPPNGKA